MVDKIIIKKYLNVRVYINLKCVHLCNNEHFMAHFLKHQCIIDSLCLKITLNH